MHFSMKPEINSINIDLTKKCRVYMRSTMLFSDKNKTVTIKKNVIISADKIQSGVFIFWGAKSEVCSIFIPIAVDT